MLAAIYNTGYQHLAAAPGRHQEKALLRFGLVGKAKLTGLARLKHAAVEGQQAVGLGVGKVLAHGAARPGRQPHHALPGGVEVVEAEIQQLAARPVERAQ